MREERLLVDPVGELGPGVVAVERGAGELLHDDDSRLQSSGELVELCHDVGHLRRPVHGPSSQRSVHETEVVDDEEV
ncbi:hypothetical protein NBG84_03450 [Streptomyces sp. CWNU-1]|uniref:Uncharacterized protein n=1 Tax=Streptomyces albipurpureus TaxID=2897419 RepID=A0ABT0UG33_9ACTN|nr:hypothetical protein [Streptomyces sp. CWNU-1]MCM2387378.1 hypothetical protein [Streptomyces sp. CWNU-1]